MQTTTPLEPAPGAQEPARRKRRVIRAAAVVAILALATGVVSQTYAEWRDARNHPAPGQIVELEDGRAIHVQVDGMSQDGPIVILEAGGGSFSSQWAWVQQQIAESAPVLSYDRAGLGWSDTPDWSERSATAAAEDLTEILDILGLEGPYVLVGHSFGAVYARAFAFSQPVEVAGMVLVDPGHEDQFEVVPAMAGQTELSLLPWLGRIGLLRLLAPFDELGDGMPEDVFADWRAVGYSVPYLEGYRDEGRHVRDVVSPWFASEDRDLGELPLVVFQASEAEWPDDAMRTLQRQLTDLSSNSEWVEVDGADHFTIVTHEHHAQLISDAVVEIIDTLGHS
jgi:pimeloyl-ACP methyl ester carboxylesterase